MQKLFTLLLLIALFAISTRAQESASISVRSICAENERVQIQVTAAHAITEVFIIPSDPQSNAIVWQPAEQLTRRFWIDSNSESLHISAFSAEGNVAAFTYELGNTAACDAPILDTEPMVECLELSLAELIVATGYTPESAFFVVDGNQYSYGDNLSFLVPENALWLWDLYIDGIHLLSFEQTETEPCHITAFYPQ